MMITLAVVCLAVGFVAGQWYRKRTVKECSCPATKIGLRTDCKLPDGMVTGLKKRESK